MPMLLENSSIRPKLKLDYIECAFGINTAKINEMITGEAIIFSQLNTSIKKAITFILIVFIDTTKVAFKCLIKNLGAFSITVTCCFLSSFENILLVL